MKIGMEGTLADRSDGICEFFSSEMEIYGRNVSRVYMTSVWKALCLLWREYRWIIACKYWHRKDYWYHQGQSDVSIRGDWRQSLCHLLMYCVTHLKESHQDERVVSPRNQIHHFYKLRKKCAAKKPNFYLEHSIVQLWTCWEGNIFNFSNKYQLTIGIY